LGVLAVSSEVAPASLSFRLVRAIITTIVALPDIINNLQFEKAKNVYIKLAETAREPTKILVYKIILTLLKQKLSAFTMFY
jgi:hypothetical protein